MTSTLSSREFVNTSYTSCWGRDVSKYGTWDKKDLDRKAFRGFLRLGTWEALIDIPYDLLRAVSTPNHEVVLRKFKFEDSPESLKWSP